MSSDSLLPIAPALDEPLEMLEACHQRIEQQLGDATKAGLQVYYHTNKGQGSWITPYRASPSGGLPISFRTMSLPLVLIQ